MSSCLVDFIHLWFSVALCRWVHGIELLLWQQGSLCKWVGVFHMKANDGKSSKNLTWRGAYLLHTPQWSCCHDQVPWVVVVVIQSAIWWHLWAGDYYPSAKCMWSCRHPLPLHITWRLHLSSVDSSVDIHGRSHSILLIHPREVLLA